MIPDMTVGLTMLIKNDIENIKKVLMTYFDFFDSIYILDHNSTDGVIEYIETAHKYYSGCCNLVIEKLGTHNIDFAEARNRLFSMVKEDYVVWLDSDDEVKDYNLQNWKCYIEANPDLDGIFVPYWYTHEDNRPLIMQYRERILKNPSNWKWEGSIHEICNSVKEGAKMEFMPDSPVLHNKDKFKSEREPQMERNYRLVSQIENPTPIQIFYLIRESAAVYDFLVTDKYYKQYEDEIETSIKSDKPAIYHMIWDEYLIAMKDYYSKREVDTEFVKKFIQKYQDKLKSNIWLSNKSIKAYIEAVGLLKDKCPEFLTKIDLINTYNDSPPTQSFTVDLTLYNGFKEFELSKHHFEKGSIGLALKHLFQAQSKYFPTQEFSDHYRKVLNYVKVKKIDIIVDGIHSSYTLGNDKTAKEFFNSANNEVVALSLTKEVIQNSDITEFCSEKCLIALPNASDFYKVLNNSKIKIIPVYENKDVDDLTWLEPREFRVLQDWRLTYKSTDPYIILGLPNYQNILGMTSLTISEDGMLQGMQGNRKSIIRNTVFSDDIIALGDVLYSNTKEDVKPFDSTYKVSPLSKSKSVFIVAGGAEEWNGLSPYTQGIGASETSLINLAQGLVPYFNVKVFCTTKEPETVQGVEYLPLNYWNDKLPKKEDIVISSRMPDILNTRYTDTQILWIHDDPDTFYLNLCKEREIDYIVCVSDAQRRRLLSKLGFLNKDRVKTIYNIVDLYSVPSRNRVKARFVFMSSPDRAIFNWIDIPQRMVSENFVFYGWNNYEEKLTLKMLREKHRLRKAGYNVVGRIDRNALMEFLPTCEFMPYFGNFFETFCSAAVECMYHGVKVIVDNNSAIREVIGNMSDKWAKTNILRDDVPETYGIPEPRTVTELLSRSKEYRPESNPYDSGLLVVKWIELFNLDHSEGSLFSPSDSVFSVSGWDF